MAACSIIRRRPASAWSASASWRPGALTGTAERHPTASRAAGTDRVGAQLRDGSGARPAADAAGHRRLCRQPGGGGDPFRHHHPAMGTILVGMATVEEFEGSLAAVLKGPLPQAALDRLEALTKSFSGEQR